MDISVQMIPALSDNYIYLLAWQRDAIIIDPSDAQAVQKVLKSKGLTLKALLITHHHFDHIAGVEELKKLYGCPVYGPDDNRVFGLTNVAKEGKQIQIGPLNFDVLFVPGHTTSHIAYFERKNHWLFSGDSLFTGGCGRLFEGSPKEMHHSLQKIAQLPDDTLIFCGHEYTQTNLSFANKIEPENDLVSNRLSRVMAQRKKGEKTVPATLKEEKETNPFLRVHEHSLKNAVGMPHANDIEVFKHIREMKDQF